MKGLYKIILIALAAYSCAGKAERNNTAYSADGATMAATNRHSYKNVQVEIKQIKNCTYPKNDPLYDRKKNKKIVVLEVAVKRMEGAGKEDIIPLGAMVTDEKGNTYETSPGVVAMAQTSGCIKGDDLKEYNGIWSGDIRTNETRIAFVVGFEIPDQAITGKFYWNKNWNEANQYILLNENPINH